MFFCYNIGNVVFFDISVCFKKSTLRNIALYGRYVCKGILIPFCTLFYNFSIVNLPKLKKES